MVGIRLGPRRPQVVAVRLLGLRTGDSLDELVATHADRPVDAPQGRRDVEVAKCRVPRERVLVVGVDERSVDIENDRADHGSPPGCDIEREVPRDVPSMRS
ncbi:MAG: hypothetical protein WKF73_04170 [Nocardioidaceae bacterium]